MSPKITDLSESLQLKIYENLSHLALCRLRSTCKKLDSSVEKQRFTLARRIKDVVYVNIRLELKELTVSASLGGNPLNALLTQPFEQLSGFPLDLHIFMENNERFDDLTALITRMQPSLHYLLMIDCNRSYPETCLDVISSCSFQKLFAPTKLVPFERYLSIDSVKKAKRVQFSANGDDVPIEGFLEQIKNLENICLEMKGNPDNVVQNVIPQLIKDAASLAKWDSLPRRILFIWEEFIEVKKAFPNLLLIYRETGVLDYMSSGMIRECYALVLPEKIFLLFVGGACPPQVESWHICVVPKDKKSLKSILTEVTSKPISERLLRHVYEIVVRKE